MFMDSVNDQERFSFSFYDDQDYHSDDSCIEISLSSGVPFLQTQESWSPTISSSRMDDIGNHHHQQQQLPCTSCRLLPTRKASKMNGSGIVKFFIKFGGASFGTMVASILKPQQVNASPSQDDANNGQKKKRGEESIQYYERLIKHIRKWLLLVQKGSKSNYCFKGLKMNEMLQSGRKTQSCPTSIKSSPIHNEYNIYTTCTRDSSIQAAIAHCKNSSSAQFPDFCFPTSVSASG